MKTALLLLCVATFASGCAARGPIRATLSLATNHPGWLVMHMMNVSSNTIRLWDIPEGTAWCGDFYEVKVEVQGKRYTSGGRCYYAPAGIPAVVEIAPQKTYSRDIQPVAYLGRADWLTFDDCLRANSEVTVTYHPSARMKGEWKNWEGLGRPPDLDLVFQTEKLRIIEPDGAANGSQRFGSGTNRTSSSAGSRR